MPALTVVTFRDEDGELFPVAIVGIPESDEAAERLGRERLDETIRHYRRHAQLSDEWPRTMELVSIEYPELPV